mgnify:CR=1 FL=1
MSENTLRGPIEAILMVASEPVAASELADVLGVSVEDVEAQLRALAAEYLGEGQDRPRGFELREVAGGWRIYSARAYADVVGRFVVGSSHARSKHSRSLPIVSPFRGRESAVFEG